MFSMMDLARTEASAEKVTTHTDTERAESLTFSAPLLGKKYPAENL